MSREKLFLLLVSIAFLLVSFGMLNADSIPSRAYLPIIVGTRIGQIDYEELKISSLESGAVHSWTVEVASSNFLTITVATAASANMIISVLDPSGQIIVDKQDQAKAGEVETVANLSAADPGSYRIDIASDPAVQTDYALMVMDSSSFTFDFRGTLTPGIQRAFPSAPRCPASSGPFSSVWEMHVIGRWSGTSSSPAAWSPSRWPCSERAVRCF